MTSTEPNDQTTGEPAPAPAAPSPPPPAAPTGPRNSLVFGLLVVYGVLAFWNSPRRDFWQDEALHAQICREMEASLAHPTYWLVPTLGGDPHFTAPPLSYWLPAVCRRLTGLPAGVAYRLPSIFFALLGLWTTFWLATRVFDRRLGFLALSIQASTWLFFVRAAWLGSDLQFAVLCQLALTSFVLAAESERRGRLALCGWLSLAAASLTTSLPLALGLVFGTLLLFLFFGGGYAETKTGLSRVASRAGIGLFLLITGAWYGHVAYHHHAEFWRQHVVQQHWERLVGEREPAPLFHYVLTLGRDYLPWTIFIPVALLHGKDRIKSAGQRLVFLWCVFTLVGLSAIPSKDAGLLLFSWPALALLMTASFFEKERSYSLWEVWLGAGIFRAVPHLLKAPLVLVVIAAAAYGSGYHEKVLDAALLGEFAEPRAVWSLLGIAALAGAGAFYAAGRVRQLVAAGELPRAAFETACATLFLLFTVSFFSPAFNAARSARPFLDTVRARVGDAPLATYGKERTAEVLYYLERELPHFVQLDPQAEAGSDADAPRSRLQEYLKTPGVYLLTSVAELEGIKSQFWTSIYRLLDEPVASGSLGAKGEHVLLKSREAPAEGR